MKDRIGVLCSGLCVIHCLAAPFILALGLSGVITAFFSTELVHMVLLIPVSIMIILTLPSVYKRHKSINLVFVGLLGLTFLVSALFFGESYETILSVVGGALIITYHVINLRDQRSEVLTTKVNI